MLLPRTPIPTVPSAPMPDRARRRWRSRIHTAVLLLAMAGLLGLCGWIVAGWDGVGWSIFGGAAALILVGRTPPEIFLHAIGAHLLRSEQVPEVAALFETLCRRAGLSPLPVLCHVDQPLPLAFSLGQGGRRAVVVADSLLTGLSRRELSGILAHEIVHLRDGDIVLKQVGFVLGWLTQTMTQLGIILLFFGGVVRAFSTTALPLLSLVVLAAAPVAVRLLQLALSRAREAEADLEAAALTGDPAGLASALVKLQRWHERRLRRLFPYAHPFHLPTILNDHPPTGERIRRLLSLAPGGFRREPDPGDMADTGF